MTMYRLDMKFTYVVETDDIEKVLEEFEFPSFGLEDDQVEFMDNINEWEVSA